MAQSCFIFECYCEGQLLFRASSQSSGLLDPLPDSPAARGLQAKALISGCRLTYFFLTTGLTQTEAAALMRRMAANDSERKPNLRPPVEVEWLPGSGVNRLHKERRNLFSEANSAVPPVEN